MRLFNQVAIIGVGLIGGSIGLGIKKKRLAKQVVGISRHKSTINLAKKRGAIDIGSLDISAIKKADLVILAAPVNSIIQLGVKIRGLIKPGTLVTDTGSTKKSVVKILEKALPNFVGGHPLSGSEKQGVANARDDLFCGSLCILTPTRKTPQLALSRIRKLWIELGSRVILLTPARHDKLISHVSHLPHIIAFSLIQSVPRSSLFLASSGLKDTTRIAASPAGLWEDIFLTNAENILVALRGFTNSLSGIRRAIKQGDARALERLLRQARLKRQLIKP
ncbi:MAG: prephenate dehydrogenase/arogenate dehydrogenase family protein [Candidatus Omnitrophota bacterium]|jgi:prephenate dehydrogenase